MSPPLLYTLIAAAGIAVGLIVFLATRRRPHPEPPAATRQPTSQRAAASTAPAPAAAPREDTDHGHAPVHGSGIQVDELYVGEDDMFSTSERHIGDTQPVDRASLNLPQPPRQPSRGADGGRTVAKAGGEGGKRR